MARGLGVRGVGVWLTSGHVGASSSILAAAILGHVDPDVEPAFPHDGADFGRCVVLFDCVGTTACRRGLLRLAEISGPWNRLAKEWRELIRAHNRDRGLAHGMVRDAVRGDVPKETYSFMIRKGDDGRWDRFPNER